MFTCGQVEHVELSTMNTLHERPSAPRGGSFLIKALVNTSRQEWCLLTTLQMAIPAVAEARDAPAAQEARWIAWKSKARQLIDSPSDGRESRLRQYWSR